MATILVQHLMNYINSYPITPKVYINPLFTLSLLKTRYKMWEAGLKGQTVN